MTHEENDEEYGRTLSCSGHGEDPRLPEYRFWQDPNDNDDLYLMLPEGSFQASNFGVEVRIPRAVWNRIVEIGKLETSKPPKKTTRIKRVK